MRGVDEQQTQMFSYLSPKKLLRAQLLQMLYSIRSERLLLEEIDYSVLFRWFVGLNLDESVWDPTSFTKNRDRLLKADVAKLVSGASGGAARFQGLTSDEHFTVDGTLLEAWASLKSFQRKEKKNDDPPSDDPGNLTSRVPADCNSPSPVCCVRARTVDSEALLASFHRRSAGRGAIGSRDSRDRERDWHAERSFVKFMTAGPLSSSSQPRALNTL
jgi:transposase